MREIVMDTETTGLNPEEGHRIVEIGAIELINHLPTEKIYHQYINPERSMPKGALDVHGLDDHFLRDKPKFADILDKFLDFIGEDSLLIFHNADFDMKMLNAELVRAGRPELPMSRSIDTVELAQNKFPGAQVNLDALCHRFNIDNSARQKHGALLDSELLAEVYIELLGGRQTALTLETTPERNRSATSGNSARQRSKPLPSRLTDSEREAHAQMVAELNDPLWLKTAR